MATLDVSRFLRNPQFADTITIIRRTDSINQHGEMTLTSDAGTQDIAVVQGIDKDTLEMLPDSARLHNSIVVFYNGRLNLQTSTTYADIVVWKGKYYEADTIVEDFGNYGKGFVKVVCVMVDAYE